MEQQILTALGLFVVAVVGAAGSFIVALINRKTKRLRQDAQYELEVETVKHKQEIKRLEDEALERAKRYEMEMAQIRASAEGSHTLNASIEHLIEIMVDQVQSERTRGDKLAAEVHGNQLALTGQTETLGELIDTVDAAGQKIDETKTVVVQLNSKYDERNPRLFEKVSQIEAVLNTLVDEVKEIEGIPAKVAAELDQHKIEMLEAIAQLRKDCDNGEAALPKAS